MLSILLFSPPPFPVDGYYYKWFGCELYEIDEFVECELNCLRIEFKFVEICDFISLFQLVFIEYTLASG